MAFVDPSLRLYGNSGSDFAFRSPNPFSNVQIVPEKILQFSVGPDGVKYYKVKWQDTWLPEHHFVPINQKLIENFWSEQATNKILGLKPKSKRGRKPKALKDAVSSSTTTAISTPTTTTAVSAAQVNTTNAAQPQNAPQEYNREAKEARMKEILSKMPKLEPERPSNQLSVVMLLGSAAQTSNTAAPAAQNTAVSVDIATTVPSANTAVGVVNTAAGAQVVNAAAANNIPLSSPTNQVTNQEQVTNSNDIINPRIENMETMTTMSDNLAQLDDATLVKRASTMYGGRRTITMDGFDILNISNTTATDDELRERTYEIMNTYGKKRSHDGSANLKQTCPFCLKVVRNRKSVNRHLFAVHLKNLGQHVCEYCDERFFFWPQLRDHLITHTDIRTFICKVCGLTCKRRAHLYTHMKTHKLEKNFRCDVCHANFNVQSELKAHCLDTHKEGGVKCNVCGHGLKSGLSVYNHSLRHHGVREYKCDECDATFKRPQHLQQHKDTHTKRDKQWKCDICTKEFVNRGSWRKHLETNHSNRKGYRYQYACHICGKDFAYKGRLDEHMKKHANETEEEIQHQREEAEANRIQDELADKFIKVKNMLGHVRLQCRICKASFKFVNGARKHYLTHVPHLKGVPGKEWRCGTCGKVFSDRRYLLRHEVTHNTQRSAYECTQCQQKFKWKFYFKKHMLQKHQITVDDATLQPDHPGDGPEEGEMIQKVDDVIDDLDAPEELNLPDPLNTPDVLDAPDQMDVSKDSDTGLQEEIHLPSADVEQLGYSEEAHLVYGEVEDGNEAEELRVYNDGEQVPTQQLVYNQANTGPNAASNEIALLEAVASSGLDLNVALDITNMGNQVVCTGDGNVEGQTFKLVAYPDPEGESTEESYVILQVAIPPENETEQEPGLGNEVDVDNSVQTSTT